MSTPFLEATFTGARFAQHALPVEALQELAEYQTLITEVARALFLEAHPDRRRVTRGFRHAFGLALAGVHGGSAVAELVRNPTVPSLSEDGDHFEKARDLLNEVIANAAADAPPPTGFPARLLPRFNKFGKSLLSDETLCLQPPGSAPRAVYTSETRTRILRRVVEEIELNFTGLVKFASVRVHPIRQAEVSLPDGRVVPCVLSEEHHHSLVAAAPSHERTWFRLVGTAIVDRQDSVRRFLDVEEFERLDDGGRGLDLQTTQQRLLELEALEDGWMDGAGIGLSRRDTGWVHNALLMIVGESSLGRPGVYPTPDGNLQAEWLVADRDLDVTAIFDLDRRTIRLEVLQLDADDEGEEQEFSPRQLDALLAAIESTTHRAQS